MSAFLSQGHIDDSLKPSMSLRYLWQSNVLFQTICVRRLGSVRVHYSGENQKITHNTHLRENPMPASCSGHHYLISWCVHVDILMLSSHNWPLLESFSLLPTDVTAHLEFFIMPIEIWQHNKFTSSVLETHGRK